LRGVEVNRTGGISGDRRTSMTHPSLKWLTGIGAVVLIFGVTGCAENGDDASATASDSTPTATEPPEETSEDTEETNEEPAEAAATASKPPKPRARTYLVARTIDGDTIELANGKGVRIVGIDTPERGECGYDRATAKMDHMVTGERVRLTMPGEDTDRYGRLLRYVNVGNRDVGLAQIKAGLAIARYDSRDGYGFHPRENKYIAADKATKDRTKCAPKPKPADPPPAQAYYENCDAARAAGAAPVHRGDPGYGSHLDRDGDGVGCES